MTREEKKAAGIDAARHARARLRAMSTEVKPLVRAGAFDTINEAIMALFYDPEGEKDFRTFWEWKRAGRRVMKGQKGSPIWGRPIDREGPQQDAQPQPEATTGPEDEDKEPFWPICYLFEASQTETDPNPQPVKTRHAQAS